MDLFVIAPRKFPNDLHTISFFRTLPASLAYNNKMATMYMRLVAVRKHLFIFY